MRRMTGVLVGIAALGVLAWSGISVADPLRDLGPARQLCIGDETECTKRIVTKLTTGANLDLIVNFEYDSAILTAAAKANLDAFAVALKDPGLRSKTILVEGHTDGKGRPDYNVDLSTRRAQAVVAYLKQRGADTSRFRARGYGSQKPIDPDPLASANRRVETRLLTE